MEKIAFVIYYHKHNFYSLNVIAGALETDEIFESIDFYFSRSLSELLKTLEEIVKKYKLNLILIEKKIAKKYNMKFAKKIFDLIDAIKNETHLRVGILGDWGSGKTTVMNFIKFHCQEKKYPVASFNPWQFHSREDARRGFVSSIDKGISRWSKSFSICYKFREKLYINIF